MSLANPSDTSNRNDPDWEVRHGSPNDHVEWRVAPFEATPIGTARGPRGGGSGPYSGQLLTDPSVRVSGPLTDPSTRVSGIG